MKYYQLSAAEETQNYQFEQQKAFMRDRFVDVRVKHRCPAFHMPSPQAAMMPYALRRSTRVAALHQMRTAQHQAAAMHE